ncbi:ATP-binding protein [Streptomyces tendae]|nr:ATP-binding protein [Streptomyces sp. S10(2018)]
MGTAALKETLAILGEVIAARGMMCVYGAAGLGKTMSVNASLRELAPGVTRRIEFRGRPTVLDIRHNLFNVLGLPGRPPRQPTAFDTLLKDVLADQFRVLVCDKAQWLRECSPQSTNERQAGGNRGGRRSCRPRPSCRRRRSPRCRDRDGIPHRRDVQAAGGGVHDGTGQRVLVGCSAAARVSQQQQVPDATAHRSDFAGLQRPGVSVVADSLARAVAGRSHTWPGSRSISAGSTK